MCGSLPNHHFGRGPMPINYPTIRSNCGCYQLAKLLRFTQRPVFLPIHFVDFEVLDCVLLTQLLSKCSFATTTDTDDRNAQGWPHSPGPIWFMGAPKGLDSSWIDLKLEIRLAQFLLVVLFDNQKTLSLFNPFRGFQDGMAESFFRSFTYQGHQWLQQHNRTNWTRKLPPNSLGHAKGAWAPLPN